MPNVVCSLGPRVADWSSIANVALIGNSIVKGVNDDATAKAVLTAGGRTVTNYAVVGHTVAQQMAVWIATNSATKAAHTLGIVQFGVNNMAAGNPAADVDRQIDAALAAFECAAPNMRLLLSMMTPCRLYDPGAGWHAEFDALNLLIAARASQRVRVVVDLFDLLSDGTGAIAAPYDSGDKLHFNAAGHLLIAQRWRARADAAS